MRVKPCSRNAASSSLQLCLGLNLRVHLSCSSTLQENVNHNAQRRPRAGMSPMLQRHPTRSHHFVSAACSPTGSRSGKSSSSSSGPSPPRPMAPKSGMPPMPPMPPMPLMPPIPSWSKPSPASSSSSSFHLFQSHLTKLSFEPSWSLSHHSSSFFFRKNENSRPCENLHSSLLSSLKNLISHAYCFPSGFL